VGPLSYKSVFIILRGTSPPWDSNSPSVPVRKSLPLLELRVFLKSPPLTPPYPEPEPSNPFYYFKIHFNIVLLSMLASTHRSPSFRFTKENFSTHFSSYAYYILSPSDHNWRRIQFRKTSEVLSTFLILKSVTVIIINIIIIIIEMQMGVCPVAVVLLQ
jgi:hypothetical protein